MRQNSQFPWKEWLLFIVLMGSLALAIVPGLYLMGQKDMDPKEFESTISHLLGVQEEVAFNLEGDALAKAKESNLNEVSFANAIAASQWEEKYFNTKVSVGILYAIDMAEWRGGGFPGSCDGLKASMGNPNVSASAQKTAVEKILSHWKEYDIRSTDAKTAEQVYPDYSGYKGGCSTGEIGSGFIPETALRVMKALEASGDPSVADWNLWKHSTTAKATAYEIGRMCPDGITAKCLGGWNHNADYRARLVTAATKLDAALTGTDLNVWSEDVQFGGDDALWKKALLVYLDLWDLSPSFIRSMPDAPYLGNAKSLYFLYGHMSRIDVEPNQQVKKGDILGLCGATGHSTGSHVHFGASNIAADAFTAYMIFASDDKGWFDPKLVLGQPGFLASPISLTGPVTKAQLDVGQDWMNKQDLNPAGHPGLDIPCVTGAPLYAIADGKVLPPSTINLFSQTGGFGQNVWIEVPMSGSTDTTATKEAGSDVFIVSTPIP